MIPQKHKEATKVIYNSGFFITTNEYPDFGAGVDGQAILRRLSIFQTERLPKVNKYVTGKIRIHIFYKQP